MHRQSLKTQNEKCEIFHSLHKKGNPIVFVNVWDAGSAKTVANMGAKAIATASWAVAASHGFEDGENIPFDIVLANAQRICAAVEVPVTIDLESGYGNTAVEVGNSVARIMEIGAIGCNIEDSYPKNGTLRPVQEAKERIAAIRERADKIGLNFFINARTDIFFQKEGEFTQTQAIDETIKRAAAFKEAGASGIFIPGVSDIGAIKELAAQIELPINIFVAELPNGAKEFAYIGVARISMGPNPYRKAIATLNSFKHLL